MGMDFGNLKKFSAPQMTIDFSFLQHNRYGFQTIKCKTQSRILTHFMTEVQNKVNYLEVTKRLKDFSNDTIVKPMVQNHRQGHFLIGRQIEHFGVNGYREGASADAREKCRRFRVFGVELDDRFFIIRIDPEHRYGNLEGYDESRI